MHAVARAQLHWHGQEYVRGPRVLTGKAAPPRHYHFPRGHGVADVAEHAGAGGAGAAVVPTTPPHHPLPDSQLLFAFHAPPHNSVDHLHLHAIAKPYTAWWESGHFAPGTPWVLLWRDAVARLEAGHHPVGKGRMPVSVSVRGGGGGGAISGGAGGSADHRLTEVDGRKHAATAVDSTAIVTAVAATAGLGSRGDSTSSSGGAAPGSA